MPTELIGVSIAIMSENVQVRTSVVSASVITESTNLPRTNSPVMMIEKCLLSLAYTTNSKMYGIAFSCIESAQEIIGDGVLISVLTKIIS